MKQVILLLIIFSICFYDCLAQEAIKANDKSFKIEIDEEWQQIEVNKFSLQIPKQFKDSKKKTIDTAIWIYQTGDAELGIYVDAFYNPKPSIYKMPDFDAAVINVDGYYAFTFAYTDDKKPLKFVNGVSFWSNYRKGFVISIYLTSNEKMKDLARKIFASIKFKPEQIRDLKLKTYQ